MNLLVDTHTHTVSSGHAYSTLTENMKEASEKGLKVVAMTDHAPKMPGGCHLYHFDNLRILPDTLFGVKLLKGVEANIIDYNGSIDVPEKTLKTLDFVIASLHAPCIPFESKDIVTEGILKVMENPYVNVIGHPGDARYPMDFEKVVLAARESKTLLEVNNASLTPKSFRPGVRENLIEMLAYCKKYEVPIVVGTDAHYHQTVGAFEESIKLLQDLKFPEVLILNTNVEAFLNYISEKRKNALES